MELKSYSSTNISTEKSFGLVFSIFFILLGLYFYTKTQLNISIFFVILSIFFIFSFVKPSIFKLPNFICQNLVSCLES